MGPIGVFGWAAILLGSAAIARSPSVSPQNSSWGKPGVTFAQYRSDSEECALKAASADVANTDAAKTLVTASRDLERASDLVSSSYTSGSTETTLSGSSGVIGGGAGAYQHSMDKYRPEQQFAAIKKFQYDLLEQCLTASGYVHFRLTKNQIGRLKHMRAGSDERRVYLHRLSSDASVIAAQRL